MYNKLYIFIYYIHKIKKRDHEPVREWGTQEGLRQGE